MPRTGSSLHYNRKVCAYELHMESENTNIVKKKKQGTRAEWSGDLPSQVDPQSSPRKILNPLAGHTPL